MTRQKKLMAGVLATCLTFVCGAGVALGVGDTGKSYIGQSVSGNSCYYARAYAVIPGGGGSQVQYLAYTYKYNRINGCSTSFSTKVFGSGENSIRAVLYRGSDAVICANTGWASTPNGVTNWGWARNYNKSGACANTTAFFVSADGYWGYDPANWYVQDGPPFNF